jgi:hypothetical protein
MGGLGKYEVVFGTLFSMQIVRIGGDYFVINPECDRESRYAA